LMVYAESNFVLELSLEQAELKAVSCDFIGSFDNGVKRIEAGLAKAAPT